MSAFIFALGLTLVHFLWQGLLLGCAAAVALTLTRNARAESRYLIGCCALLACLCWPAAELLLRLAGGASANVAGAQVMRLAAQSFIGDATPFDLRGSVKSIVGLWALCAAVLSLRMLLGLLWIERAGRAGAANAHWEARLLRLAERFGVTRAVRLRVVDLAGAAGALASPVTAGCWRPVVLLPAALVAGMPPDLLEALLAHEMAHIRRHDYLVNLLQNVIETLLFYHPAVWWISHRVRVERELIADGLAARQLGEPRRLALALSELERLQFSTHHLAQAANGGNLMERIQRLLRPAPQAMNWKAAIPMLGLAFACISVYAQATAADKATMHAEATANTNATAAATDKAAMKRRSPLVDFSTCAKPVYPAEAIASRRTGTVTLNFLVDIDGKAKASKVKKSSGHTDLDEASRTAIEKCSFNPATQAGKPVKTWMAMQYVWTLE